MLVLIYQYKSLPKLLLSVGDSRRNDPVFTRMVYLGKMRPNRNSKKHLI